MSKLYWVENGQVKEKEGTSTRTVGYSNAIHVSQGFYDGQEAYVICYANGDVKMTRGTTTSDVNHGLSGSRIVSSQFHDKGVILTNDKGERYYRHSGGGNKL